MLTYVIPILGLAKLIILSFRQSLGYAPDISDFRNVLGSCQAFPYHPNLDFTLSCIISYSQGFYLHIFTDYLDFTICLVFICLK